MFINIKYTFMIAPQNEIDNKISTKHKNYVIILTLTFCVKKYKLNNKKDFYD